MSFPWGGCRYAHRRSGLEALTVNAVWMLIAAPGSGDVVISVLQMHKRGKCLAHVTPLLMVDWTVCLQAWASALHTHPCQAWPHPPCPFHNLGRGSENAPLRNPTRQELR